MLRDVGEDDARNVVNYTHVIIGRIEGEHEGEYYSPSMQLENEEGLKMHFN